VTRDRERVYVCERARNKREGDRVSIVTYAPESDALATREKEKVECVRERAKERENERRKKERK